MYQNNKVLAFIPARKNSKRLPNKNKLLLQGKPVFEYSIEVAKSSKYVDAILFSSDSKEMLNKAHELGTIKNELRPEALAKDTTKTEETMEYELNRLPNKKQYACVVLLQPTFPLRTVEMLDKAIEEFFEQGEKSLITVVKATESPVFMRKIDAKKQQLEKILDLPGNIRTQELQEYYLIRGSIYINPIEEITKKAILNENKIPFEIAREFAIDIDTREDFEQVERIMKKWSKYGEEN